MTPRRAAPVVAAVAAMAAVMVVAAVSGVLLSPPGPVASAGAAARAVTSGASDQGLRAGPEGGSAEAFPAILQLVGREEARRLDRSVLSLGRYLAGTAAFRVSTFNLLGNGHTAPGGDRRGWAPGRVRMGWAMRLLDSARVDVVGFQEFQRPQFRAFRSLAGRRWAAYPGLRFGPRPVQNSVAWRTDVWRLERARTLPVPYFFGRMMRMPAVELRNRSTGRHVWFVNVHNPADKFGTAGGWRAQATALEGELVRRLHAAGSPVVLTGDFNDHAGAFCAIAAIAPVVSADGGTSRAGCEPPADPAIDWIFATRGVQLTDYVRRRGALVRRTTDHPFVYASARIPPATTRSGS